MISFLLLGAVCALAGLCYAELASMIPQAGSAYAYSYATLGEIIAWIIGWDLILEYAVGNIAVAIAWSGYFSSFISAFGIGFPDWLTHGYRTALLSADPAVHGLLETAPRVFGIPVLLNIPAFVIVMLITWLLYIGVKESVRANNIMVVIKLLVLDCSSSRGDDIDTANTRRSRRWRGIPRAPRSFSPTSVRCHLDPARRRKSAADMPSGFWGLAICTLIYVIVGASRRAVPYESSGATPWRREVQACRSRAGSWPSAQSSRYRGLWSSSTVAAHLLRHGRDGLLPLASKIIRSTARAHTTSSPARRCGRESLLDENEIYD